MIEARELLGAFAIPRNWQHNFDGAGLVYLGPGSGDIAAEKKLPAAVQGALALLDSQQDGVWLTEKEAEQVRVVLKTRRCPHAGRYKDGGFGCQFCGASEEEFETALCHDDQLDAALALLDSREQET